MLNMMIQTSNIDKSMVIWLTYCQEHAHEHDSETLHRKDNTLEISPAGDFATINWMVNGKSTKQGEFCQRNKYGFNRNLTNTLKII